MRNRIPQIRSKHPSHASLRGNLNPHSFSAVIRLGSTTPTSKCYPKKNAAQLARVVEINTIEAVKNSANKLRMKKCFYESDVKTADWYTYNDIEGSFLSPNGDIVDTEDLSFPIVSKHIFGSRGTGNKLHKTIEELEAWARNKDLNNYIFEKFYNYNREYRLHVTKDGCFYTCRKVLRNETPESERWYRNDNNCNWLVEENESFDKPVNWDSIVSECVKALESVGLDIGGFDVRVQSAIDKRGRVRENPNFIIVESNSACSHGDITSIKYKDKINSILNEYEYSRRNVRV